MDGRRELDWMEELAAAHPTQTFRVGIRVNFDLEKCARGRQRWAKPEEDLDSAMKTGHLQPF